MNPDSVLLSWTGKEQLGREEVYRSLVEAVEELKNKDPEARNLYHVVWESTNHHHDSTKYAIQGFGSLMGEPTMDIEGGRGGNYRILTKSFDYPWIHYLPPNKPEHHGWTEELTKLAVLTEEFEYVKQNGWRGFLKRPFDVLQQHL